MIDLVLLPLAFLYVAVTVVSPDFFAVNSPVVAFTSMMLGSTTDHVIALVAAVLDKLATNVPVSPLLYK